MWKLIDESVKDGRTVLLGNPDKKSGPHIGFWWTHGNCLVCSNVPSWTVPPTHYVDINHLSF